MSKSDNPFASDQRSKEDDESSLDSNTHMFDIEAQAEYD
jgi:hypothetical protein